MLDSGTPASVAKVRPPMPCVNADAAQGGDNYGGDAPEMVRLFMGGVDFFPSLGLGNSGAGRAALAAGAPATRFDARDSI